MLIFPTSKKFFQKIFFPQIQDGDCPSWTCIGNDESPAPEMPVPRVKLTGSGKMPVADMRAVNHFQATDLNGQCRCSLTATVFQSRVGLGRALFN
jgi:hypothetical protein